MKLKRAILAAVVLVLLVVGTSAAFVWWSAGSAPDWYPAVENKQAPPAGRPQAPRGDEDADALLLRLQREGSITVDGDDLARLATEGLADSRDGREFLRVSKGLEGQIRDGEIEVGGIFDLSAIDESALSPDTRDGLVKLRQAVPFLVTGERYLGVRGTPEERDGDLAFASDATLRVGQVGLPLALIGWLDADGSDTPRLELPDLRVTGVRMNDDRVTIEAQPSRH